MAYNNSWTTLSTPDDNNSPWSMFRDIPQSYPERLPNKGRRNITDHVSNDQKRKGCMVGHQEHKTERDPEGFVNGNANAKDMVCPVLCQTSLHQPAYSSIMPKFYSPDFGIPKNTKNVRAIEENGKTITHEYKHEYSAGEYLRNDSNTKSRRDTTPDLNRLSTNYKDRVCFNAAENIWWPIKSELPAEFQQDLGSCVDRFNCNSYDCECNRNQWSPVLHESDQNNEVEPNCRRNNSESRRLSNAYHSERSSYSTDTSDEENGYDIVDWSHEYADNCDVKHCESSAKHGEECGDDNYGTPPSSPILDLSALNGYHTAPNSPGSESGDFCLVGVPIDATCIGKTDKKGDAEDIQTPHTACGNGRENVSDKQMNANAVEHMDDSTHISALDTFTESVSASLKEIETEKRAQQDTSDQNTPYRQQFEQNPVKTVLKMKTPPFISVDSIQYEADPKTGSVRTVGKGSFGQVFKARFADPMFHHMPIVVKEFDEEFTNRREILLEAQRLLYLNDTGYVPICYGLVCLGDPKTPAYGIVQEYIGSGLTLEQMLWDQYDLPLDIWLNIAFQCCEGLAKFHEKGILLNDIKSNNIILDFYQQSVTIKYVDFGLATGMSGKRYKNTKSLEDFVYLAPEVRKHGKVTSVETDIYSLGYMLDQINSFAGVQELKYVANLCMDINPNVRLPVLGACSLIRDHMITIGVHGTNHYGYLPSHNLW